MEYHLSKKSLGAACTALDTVSEQPVDIDLTLPDYCPDVERILRCTLIPKLYLSNLSGDRLSVEGGACVRIEYLDSDKGCVRSFEYTQPFSGSFTLRDSPGDCAVYVSSKPEYINCRALSPRKLSLHGAFSLYARVVCSKSVTYCDSADSDDLQIKSEVCAVSELCGVCRDMFNAREDISLSGHPDISSLITHSLTAHITELRAAGGRIMLSAEGRLELMYQAMRDGEPQLMSCSFPITRVIDCEGADEDSVIEPRLDVMTYDLTLSDDALDGARLLSIDSKLCFNAMCYREREISVISDAFSTTRDAQIKTEPLTFNSNTRCLTFSDSVKTSVTAEDGIAQVIEVTVRRITASAAISGGTPLLSSKLNIGMMYVNSEGEKRCIDRDADFDYNPSADNIDSVDSVTAEAQALSYRIVNAKTVELRAQLCYRMTVSQRISRAAVTSVTAPDEAAEKHGGETLVLYYADKGESLWSIAKRCRARPEDIRADNGVEDEILPDDAMLMIVMNGE